MAGHGGPEVPCKSQMGKMSQQTLDTTVVPNVYKTFGSERADCSTNVSQPNTVELATRSPVDRDKTNVASTTTVESQSARRTKSKSQTTCVKAQTVIKSSSRHSSPMVTSGAILENGEDQSRDTNLKRFHYFCKCYDAFKWYAFQKCY